jgi:predicted DNA binding CopG/RHH family protein
MERIKLDLYEQEIEKALEAGEYEPLSLEEKEMFKKEAREAAREFMKRKKSVSIRLAEYDLKRLKHRAEELGLPYQTIISLLVRKYVRGELKIEL